MQSREELEKIVADTSLSQATRDRAAKILSNEFAGDEVAQKMLQLASLIQGTSGAAQGVGVDREEVSDIVREVIEEDKIAYDDLDADLKSRIAALPKSIQLTIIQQGVTRQQAKTIEDGADRPLIQKVLSDLEARNNVYLYGGAGTGKTYAANTISKILDWELIEVNCNQFTSPLELIGGQTIDGYQEGKVVRAFANLAEDGKSPMAKQGCVLLLDELPKLDPNTAGILNSALAKISDYDMSTGEAAKITNGRGQRFARKNIFVMATGNTLLNSDSVDYEANFKQDLSLQDRFVGSTYEVYVDVAFEWSNILAKKWAFIFIFMNKVRRAIFANGFQSKAFVSIRIMKALQKTYMVYRTITDNPGRAQFTAMPSLDTSFTPATNTEGNLTALSILEPSKVKSIEDALDEFFNLFTDEQRSLLKEQCDFDGFMRIIEEKNRIADLDKLNTESELAEVEQIIKTSPRN
jgi:cobaltochelatase CobS